MAAKYPGDGEQPPTLNNLPGVALAAASARDKLVSAIGDLAAIKLWIDAHMAAMENMQLPAGAEMGHAQANVNELLAAVRPVYLRTDSFYQRIEALRR